MLSASVDISNMWVFDSGFFIHPTWLGYGYVLSRINSTKASTTVESLAANEYKNDSDKDLNELLKNEFGYITLAVGFMF